MLFLIPKYCITFLHVVTKTIGFQMMKDGGTSTITSPKVFAHEISANHVHFDTFTNQENNSSPTSLATTPYVKDYTEDFNSLAQFAEKIYNNSLSEET